MLARPALSLGRGNEFKCSSFNLGKTSSKTIAHCSACLKQLRGAFPVSDFHASENPQTQTGSSCRSLIAAVHTCLTILRDMP
mmetsp:Transcript_22977/g.41290  ORF Transcript_22977/g.41290 Transcript_22977/m.41290 type:complete len:82 (+) Transcript_22977:249-494(+)